MRNSVANADDISDANGYSHCYAYGDSYGDSNPAGITYTNGNRYGDSYTDCYASRDANTKASPDPAASSVRMVISDR